MKVTDGELKKTKSRCCPGYSWRHHLDFGRRYDYHFSSEGKCLGSYPSEWKGTRRNVTDFYEDGNINFGYCKDRESSTISSVNRQFFALPMGVRRTACTNDWRCTKWMLLGSHLGKRSCAINPSSNPQSKEVICKLQPATLEGTNKHRIRLKYWDY